ncbi:glycosyltransferase family 2 protein [Reyranella sp.]|uniref:glycosyltransferase family 2 protein n=1 Tax=Reyranella sp. TaxID=1929291 RepID=UPI003D0ED6D0
MAVATIGRLLPVLAQRACHRAGLDDTTFSAAARNFDLAHYERFAGRRFSSKDAALFHYLRVGSPRGWEPRADFSPAHYRQSNPDIVAEGYEPFAHYCRFGRHEGRGGTAAADHPEDASISAPSLRQILERPRPRRHGARVDVVMPVYGNRPLTMRAIDSVLAANVTEPFELIVVDDASPDAVLAAELRQLAERGLVSLLVNDSNLGFVRSANRGLLLHENRDVVLLNSDTQVFGDWLGRLLAVLHGAPAIATATPLSNAATILSYPVTLRENARTGLDFAALDEICARANQKPVELPTGIGFCMAIKRTCIDEIGAFNAAQFGLGYGEENDFCRRAAEKGWRNVAATNVFVWHRGGGSFGGQREKLVAAAQLSLERLHPGYRALVGEFIAHDPLKAVRAKLDARRVAADTRAKILHLGDGDKGEQSNGHDLMVRLVPDIAPFWGAYRPTISTIPSVPNLARITNHTQVGCLMQLMADLHIEKLCLGPKASCSVELEHKLINAARESGILIDRIASGKPIES